MKLFAGFVVFCFLLGTALDSWQQHRRVALLGSICVGVCIGYFFLHQI